MGGVESLRKDSMAVASLGGRGEKERSQSYQLVML